MNPLLFGPSATPLYGMHHTPQIPGRSHGIVICYPFGQEYMRAHRACRQLSLLLAKQGFHVLRYDYRGTGDSSGEIDDVTKGDWTADVGHAIQELAELTAVSTISVVGLRLGAMFAALACQPRADVKQLVVWDPVVSGAEYVEELRRLIASEVPNSYGPPSGNREYPDGSLHYNGFVMSPVLREELSALRLDAVVPTSVARVLQLVSHESPTLARLRDAWRVHPSFKYQFTPAPHDWNFVDEFGGILLPQPAIQGIVSWLADQEE